MEFFVVMFGLYNKNNNYNGVLETPGSKCEYIDYIYLKYVKMIAGFKKINNEYKFVNFLLVESNDSSPFCVANIYKVNEKFLKSYVKSLNSEWKIESYNITKRKRNQEFKLNDSLIIVPLNNSTSDVLKYNSGVDRCEIVPHNDCNSYLNERKVGEKV